MKDKSDVENLEKIIGQLQGMHSEIAQLSKRSPNDAVNVFKLRLINRVIEICNVTLGPQYLPFEDFHGFDPDDLPSTSDVTLVLSQYMEEAERYRADNIQLYGSRWFYVIGESLSDMPAGVPAKVTRK